MLIRDDAVYKLSRGLLSSPLQRLHYVEGEGLFHPTLEDVYILTLLKKAKLGRHFGDYEDYRKNLDPGQPSLCSFTGDVTEQTPPLGFSFLSDEDA